MPDEGTLTAAQIAALEDEGVAAAAEYASARSPFYRELFAQARLAPREVRSTADLSRLPTTSKRDFAAGTRRFLAVPEREVIDVPTTSGTSGRPTVWMLTERDLSRLRHNEELSFACAGVTAQETAFLSVTLDRCFMAGLAYFEGLRALGVTVVRLGPASPAMHLELLDELRPTLIVSVPSFLKRLARYAAAQGRDLGTATIRKAVCIGEPVRQADFALNPLGRTIAEAWNAQVFATYGVTELATSCCECAAGAGSHVHPELCYLEILDEAGSRLPPGQVGEVTATVFGVEAMPLLRFRTGDCSFLVAEPCACGRRTPRLGPILGRKDQLLKLKGTSVFPGAIMRALDGVSEVFGYVLIASQEDVLSDRLEVLVAARREDRALREELRERILGEAKVTPELRFVSAEEIERLQTAAGSRKRQVFIDQRQGQPQHERPSRARYRAGRSW